MVLTLKKQKNQMSLQRKQQLKIAKNRKGETSRQFKNIDKTTAEYQSLLQDMQKVSSHIKELEARIKTIEADNEDKPETISDSNTSSKSPFFVINQHTLWAKDFSFNLITANEFSKWDNFLQLHQASGYHQSAWFELIKKSFGHETQILVAEDKHGNILGGLPLTFFYSKLFGKFATSIPYVNYGGIVSEYFNVAQKLIESARSIRTNENLSHIEIRTMQAGLANNSLDKKVSMVLPLPENNDELEKRLGTKIRAQYKKADAYSPSVKFGKLELLNDFYQVFARNMRDLGTPVYSKF